MATGVEFFAFYDIFSGGLFSAILLFLYFWIYTYIAMRGTDKKADEFSLQILLPPLIIAFFLPLFIQNSIIWALLFSRLILFPTSIIQRLISMNGLKSL